MFTSNSNGKDVDKCGNSVDTSCASIKYSLQQFVQYNVPNPAPAVYTNLVLKVDNGVYAENDIQLQKFNLTIQPYDGVESPNIIVTSPNGSGNDSPVLFTISMPNTVITTSITIKNIVFDNINGSYSLLEAWDFDDASTISFVMTDCSIKRSNGMCVINAKKTTFTFQNLQYNTNKLVVSGMNLTDCVAQFTKSDFSYNMAFTNYGSVLRTTGGRYSFTDCTFNSNSAKYGGSIYAVDSLVTITGSVFNQNTVFNGGSGSAIYFNVLTDPNMKLSVDSTYFGSNTLTAVFINTTASIPLSESKTHSFQRCTFTENINNALAGASRGGSIRISNSPVDISNSILNKEQANYGGSIYMSSSYLNLNNVTITDSNSTSGGSIYTFNSILDIYKSNLTQNFAKNGAAIFCQNSSTISITDSTITGANNTIGTGIYCDSQPCTVKSDTNNYQCDKRPDSSSSSGENKPKPKPKKSDEWKIILAVCLTGGVIIIALIAVFKKNGIEHVSEDGKRFIDSPGLNDENRDQIALKIQSDLKNESNYKNYFTYTLIMNKVNLEHIETLGSFNELLEKEQILRHRKEEKRIRELKYRMDEESKRKVAEMRVRELEIQLKDEQIMRMTVENLHKIENNKRLNEEKEHEVTKKILEESIQDVQIMKKSGSIVEKKSTFLKSTQFCENNVHYVGNGAAGKSVIFNSIAKQVLSASGVSIGCGLTKQNHEFISEDGKRYIDTPGLADPLKREQAAMNIEAALKKETNYKIVFVVALNDGRMKNEDIETIQSVLGSVSVEFNYALIINKVSNNVNKYLYNSNYLKLGLDLLKRQPESKLVVPMIPELFEEDNKLIKNETIRNEIIGFINEMKPSLILEENVSAIDTRNFDERVKEIRLEYSKLLEEEKQLRLHEEEKRKEAEKKGEEEKLKRIYAENVKDEAEKQREEQEKKKLEEIQKRIETELVHSNSIVKIETEFKIDYSNERIVHRQEKKKLFFKWKYNSYEDKYHTENMFTRIKSTKGNGEIVYSDWTLVSSVEKKLYSIHINTKTKFLGNGAAGKSVIFNSIAKQVLSASGVSIGCGLTKENHEFISEDGKRYIDTPGLADPLLREQAAMNISTALKKETNYKIVFVVALNDGRMKNEDIETINSIVDSVSVEFNYALIINKVSNNIAKKLVDSNNMKLCLGLLKRQPESILIIPMFRDLFEEDNMLIKNETIRNEIIEFINEMEPSLILEENVSAIDTRNFDERVKEIQLEYSKLLEEEKQLRLHEEEKRIEAEKKGEEEKLKRIDAENSKDEAVKQRNEQEKMKLEEQQKRIETEKSLSNSIVKTETEKKEEVTNERIVHRNEKKKSFGGIRSKTTSYEDKYHTVSHYTRIKSTRGNGEIVYSDWALVSSFEKMIYSVRTGSKTKILGL
eukprot:gene9708-11922_t